MEGDAGASPLNPEYSAESEAGADRAGTEVTAEGIAAEPVLVGGEEGPSRGPSRLDRRWVIGICAALVLLAAGVATGGYFGLRYHQESQVVVRDNAAALAAAKDCVVATQVPASADMAAAEQKLIECATGEFHTQAVLYSGMFVQAYQAAKVQVQVSEIRAGVERDNDDGSVDVLVAFRVKVDNIEAKGREFGYRLRAQMAREDGQYRIAKLDQVAK